MTTLSLQSFGDRSRATSPHRSGLVTRIQVTDLFFRLILPLKREENSPFSPMRLTVLSDSPYEHEALFVPFQVARMMMGLYVFLFMLVFFFFLFLALLWRLDWLQVRRRGREVFWWEAAGLI